ncbi:GNAT family N-acetyltransferase [Mariniflexile ostreae]|uniref:GNAT family N-acetyltransferase n=1 Tax=Mariniflexile ostreae TaxID=1520892 RepID=A0ABV5FDT1_9FLAO
MKHIRREQFIWDFLNQGVIPVCYEKVSINHTDYLNKDAKATQNQVLYVSLVPTYLNYKLVNHDLYNSLKVVHKGKDGAGIFIDGPYTIDAYLEKFTKKQLRINLKRAISRLETSFNISYEYNFGDISEEKCDFLLSELRAMLIKRFSEKKTENMFLREWDMHTKNLAKQINNKKASLFVIYSDKSPISISLNVHINDTMLMAKTNAYDTAYSKFSLGHLDNYILLDWCLKNNYNVLDLGFGIMEYKMKWCNVFYNFEYHIYYKKHSILAKAIAAIEVKKIQLKNKIKTLNIKERVLRLKSFLKTPEQTEVTPFRPSYVLEVVASNDQYKASDLKNIDITSPAFDVLKQPVYEYLYSNQLHMDSISVYKIVNEAHSYILKTGSNLIKINILGHEN